MRREALVRRELARMVMIEVAHARAAVEEPQHVDAVRVERHVEHRDFVAGTGPQAVEKPRAPLGPGDQVIGASLDHAELLERVQAVGVAVEGENACHATFSFGAARRASRVSTYSMRAARQRSWLHSPLGISSSGMSGGSYGAEMPVNSFTSPARALRYRPFVSRASHTCRGALM